LKVIKNIFICLGVLFAVCIAISIYLGFKSAEFKKTYSPFAQQFMVDFSQDWEIADVQPRLSNDFLAQMETPNAKQAMFVFRNLGKVIKMQDMELKNFRTSVGSGRHQFGAFVFKADFENASGLVTLTVVINKDGARIQRLHINPTTTINKTPVKANI